MQAYDNFESDIRAKRGPILVECIDPKRSAHVECCLFAPDWTDAIAEFMAAENLTEDQVQAIVIRDEEHAASMAIEI